MPKGASLAGGETYNVTLKKSTAFDWLFPGAEIFFFPLFYLIAFSQISIN